MVAHPLLFASQAFCLLAPYLLGMPFLKDLLWSLLKGTESPLVLNLIWLGEQSKVFLVESQGIVVLELVVLWWRVLRNTLLLQVLSEGILGLKDIWNSLDGHHTSCLSQLLNRGHSTLAQCHGTSQLECSLLASKSAELVGPLLSSLCLLLTFLRDHLVALLGLWDEGVDWILSWGVPGWHLGREGAYLIKDLLCSESDSWVLIAGLKTWHHSV